MEKKTTGKSYKKIIFNAVFLFAIFGLTMYGVFRGKDIDEILHLIKGTDVRFLAVGTVCMIFFVWGESIIIHYLLGSLKIRLKKWKCFLVSNVGFFFSLITPSASGGQPMQIYYMRREKIPVPVSTMVLMIVTITYKLVLVVVGLGLMIFGNGFLHHYMRDILPVFYLGIFLNVICVAAMLILAFHPTLAKCIVAKGLTFLEKAHIFKHKPQRMERLLKSMESYQSAAAYLQSHFSVMWNVFLITMLQRFALFFVTYFIYRAFHLHGFSMWGIVFMQAAISVSVDMLPLPGGMGISEKLFMMIFMPVFGVKLLLPGMILARGLGYYVQLLMCAVLTGVGQFTLGKERKLQC